MLSVRAGQKEKISQTIKIKIMKTKIYGASDDLIEIEGAVEEEANHIDAKNILIKASDGTQAKISYDDNGEWKIRVEVEGSKYLGLVHSVGDDAKHIFDDAIGCTSYSDVLILDEGIEWVKVARKTFKAES